MRRRQGEPKVPLLNRPHLCAPFESGPHPMSDENLYGASRQLA